MLLDEIGFRIRATGADTDFDARSHGRGEMKK